MSPGVLSFTAEDLRRRAIAGLLRDAPPLDAPNAGMRAELELDPETFFSGTLEAPRLAAVLVPVRDLADSASVILTERTATMPSHAGQISFPGGRLAYAETPLEAALREAEEEIGLGSEDSSVIGYLDPYRTGTGYLITPVVAVVRGDFVPVAQEREVASVFDVPLSFLMDPTNHSLHERDMPGRRRRYYAMTYGERFIWGATAAMLMNLYERIYRAC